MSYAQLAAAVDALGVVNTNLKETVITVKAAAALARDQAQQAVVDAEAVIAPLVDATSPPATLSPAAVFPVSFGLGLLQTTLGAISNWLSGQFNFSVTFEQFGAKGDGATLDDTAIAAAVATGKVIKTRDDAVYLMSKTVLKEGGAFILTGRATFKLKAATILNDDTDKTHHTPLFRLQGMTRVDLGKCTFDGNRDEQTYPTTGSGLKTGTGSNPYRHNGLVEISPDATGTTPSAGVYITGARFQNAYMNGLALWQVKNAIIRDCVFTNTTWNGISGAGLRNVKFRFNHFYRCGVSDAYPTARQQGDRAGVQVREFPKAFTTESEGIPCIITGDFAAGGLNYDVEFTGNVGEECNVETIFGRAIRGLTGSGNTSINVGYGRRDTANFYPGHFWFEYCEGSFNNNSVYQTKVEPGDMRPDGYVAGASIGDASSLFPMIGVFNLDIRGNRALSGKDAAGAPVPGLLYRGIRMSANVNADGAYIDGTDNNGITIINTDALVPPAANVRNCSANSSTILNTNLSVDAPGEGPIGVQRFGADTTGDIDNLSAMNCRVDAGKNVIVFNANLGSFNKTNVQSSTGLGWISVSDEMLTFTTDGPVYRRVKNTNGGTASVAGFQAQSNAGNLLTMGATSSTYTGSAAVALAAFIQASTANSAGLYISANGGPIVMRPNGTRAMTLFASGRTKFGANTVDDGINLLQVGGLLGLQNYTVAALPVGVSNNSVAIAKDGRKVGEGAGAGTGVPVYYSNGSWRVFSTDTVVTT